LYVNPDIIDIINQIDINVSMITNIRGDVTYVYNPWLMIPIYVYDVARNDYNSPFAQFYRKKRRIE